MRFRKAKTRAILIGAVFLGADLLIGGQPGPHREGDYWVETTTGSGGIAEGEQLKITLNGDVVVKGSNRAEVEYALTRRVRAGSLAEAKDAMGNTEISLARHGRYMRLTVGDETGPVSLQVTIPRKLSGLAIETSAGSVEVADFDGSVIARTSAGEVRMTHIKGSVDVNTGGGIVRLGDIGAWAKAGTSAGDIVADSIGGEARFETGGGDITVQKVGADIRAITGGGRVRIGQSGGSVIASNGGGGAIDIGRAGGTVNAHNSGGGPILIGSASGIQCENASGAIHAGSSGVIRIATASGNVVAQFQGDKLLSDSFVSTGSGDITVFLPSNLSVTVRVQNSGATRPEGIVSEFSGLQTSMASGVASARGALNGGGPLLQIQGTSGTIRIKKK